eukprot:355093-Chlamydomonas_euryale.AAC.7
MRTPERGGRCAARTARLRGAANGARCCSTAVLRTATRPSLLRRAAGLAAATYPDVLRPAPESACLETVQKATLAKPWACAYSSWRMACRQRLGSELTQAGGAWRKGCREVGKCVPSAKLVTTTHKQRSAVGRRTTFMLQHRAASRRRRKFRS